MNAGVIFSQSVLENAPPSSMLDISQLKCRQNPCPQPYKTGKKITYPPLTDCYAPEYLKDCDTLCWEFTVENTGRSVYSA